MPVCKNDKKKNYKGSEKTPLGLGFCASGYKVDKMKKGKDGKMYMVVKYKNGKRWQVIKRNRNPRGRGTDLAKAYYAKFGSLQDPNVISPDDLNMWLPSANFEDNYQEIKPTNEKSEAEIKPLIREMFFKLLEKDYANESDRKDDFDKLFSEYYALGHYTNKDIDTKIDTWFNDRNGKLENHINFPTEMDNAIDDRFENY